MMQVRYTFDTTIKKMSRHRTDTRPRGQRDEYNTVCREAVRGVEECGGSRCGVNVIFRICPQRPPSIYPSQLIKSIFPASIDAMVSIDETVPARRWLPLVRRCTGDAFVSRRGSCEGAAHGRPGGLAGRRQCASPMGDQGPRTNKRLLKIILFRDKREFISRR